MDDKIEKTNFNLSQKNMQLIRLDRCSWVYKHTKNHQMVHGQILLKEKALKIWVQKLCTLLLSIAISYVIICLYNCLQPLLYLSHSVWIFSALIFFFFTSFVVTALPKFLWKTILLLYALNFFPEFIHISF